MEFISEAFLLNFSLLAITFSAVSALVMLLRQTMGGKQTIVTRATERQPSISRGGCQIEGQDRDLLKKPLGLRHFLSRSLRDPQHEFRIGDR